MAPSTPLICPKCRHRGRSSEVSASYRDHGGRQARVRIVNASRLQEGETPSIVGRIPMPIDEIPVRFLDELLGAMRQATHDLFAWMELWAEWKDSRPDEPEPS